MRLVTPMPTPTNFEERTVRTTQDLKDILDQITFKRTVVDFKWRFGIKEMVLNSTDAAPRNGWLIWGEFQRPDTNTGQIGWGRGRDELVYEGALESSVVKTAWVVVEMLIKHELM